MALDEENRRNIGKLAAAIQDLTAAVIAVRAALTYVDVVLQNVENSKPARQLISQELDI
jgi:hypothetical protein